MRILNTDEDKVLSSVCIYLTPSELREMKGYIDDLVNEETSHHIHLNDDSYEHEITLAIYTNDNLDQFDERSKKLILKDS
jgi:hypothetical protein